MYKSSTEIKVGLFMLAAIGIFVWMAVRLGGFSIGQSDTYQVSTVFPSASGLKMGVAVEVAGIQVGTVAAIELYDDQEALVTMNIQDGIRLPQSSAAYIRSAGVLGDKYVELVPGTAAGEEPLAQGDMIATAKASADMGELFEKLGSIADDIKKITGPLAEGDTGADVRDLVASLKSVSQRLDTLVSENESGLKDTLANLNASMANIKDVTDKLAKGEGTLGQLINDDGAMRELRGALSSIQGIAGKINGGEGTLGRLVNDETTVDKIDQALTGINKYLEKEDKFKVFVDYRADYLSRHDYLKSTVNIRLQPAPDRYYLLGVTGDYFGQYKRTDHKHTGGGGVSESTDEKWERDKLKFNAQIARRLYDAVLRGGIFENGAGVGVDYYLLDDDLKLTFEMFSGDFDHNPHLRAMASYNIWKIFYVSLGYDDFASDQGHESPFVGFGLSFSDDDLKSLLSGASSLL